MSNEEVLKSALHHLINSDEHGGFFAAFIEKQISSEADLSITFQKYKKHLLEKNQWSEELEIVLKLIGEQSNIIQQKNTTSHIYYVNNSQKINDSWIKEFIEDLNKCLTGDYFAEEERRRYKTIKEYSVLYGVNGEELSKVYTKFCDFNHPFVNFKVSSILYNSKDYTNGLPILQQGLKSIASYPNFYWNSKYGVEAAAGIIGDFLYLLGHKVFIQTGLISEKIKLLKLLYLYLSRYIYMTNSDIRCVDFYANRAKIVKECYLDFIGIFDWGVNPDIQFISDMYLAHQTGMNHGLPMFTKPYDQFYWDSMKMYRHGSHVPNGTGGYHDIEDRTWKELVRDGEIRSIVLSEKLLKAFSNYELNLSNATIETLFAQLYETKKDAVDEYLTKINQNKLGDE
jgi:hypothetical protein